MRVKDNEDPVAPPAPPSQEFVSRYQTSIDPVAGWVTVTMDLIEGYDATTRISVNGGTGVAIEDINTWNGILTPGVVQAHGWPVGNYDPAPSARIQLQFPVSMLPVTNIAVTGRGAGSIDNPPILTSVSNNSGVVTLGGVGMDLNALSVDTIGQPAANITSASPTQIVTDSWSYPGWKPKNVNGTAPSSLAWITTGSMMTLSYWG